jgi:hypothetical protein
VRTPADNPRLQRQLRMSRGINTMPTGWEVSSGSINLDQIVLI